MKKVDLELIRHYLATQEKAIASSLNSVNAIKEALIESQPEFQKAYLVKYENLMKRSIEAAASSDFSEVSALDQIIQILQDCD
jgi:hypothetical protein